MTTKTPEELLRPRYIVIADWPNGDLPKGLIVTNIAPGRWSDFKEYEFSETELWFKRYPHLFRRLEWWEHRSPEEMPEYVKTDSGWSKQIIIKVNDFYGDDKEYISLLDCDEYDQYCTSWFEPSTHEEYITYITTTPSLPGDNNKK